MCIFGGGGAIQALFRKLATALPGMETAPVTSNANLIDIKVRERGRSVCGARQAYGVVRCCRVDRLRARGVKKLKSYNALY